MVKENKAEQKQIECLRKKHSKESIEWNLALIKDSGDWHYAYGLIEMASACDLISNDEANNYKAAADQARRRKQENATS